MEQRRVGTPSLELGPHSLDELSRASPFSYSRCLELMLRCVSNHGPPCHLMVASHNEESVRQATKRYEVEGWETRASRKPLCLHDSEGRVVSGGTRINPARRSPGRRILQIFHPNLLS
jgi:hypothetical protein